jgi:hypothetical protein
VTAVHTFEEWTRLLAVLDLPPEPSVLVLAPDTERELLQALQRVRPAASVTMLDIPLPASSRHESASPAGATPRRLVLMPGTELGLSRESVDVVLCDHAIDDLVVGAVARHEGIFPAATEAGEYASLPRAVRAYWRSGDLESVAAPEFVSVVRSLLQPLRPSACLVFHHEVLDAHLVGGHPLDLYAEYLSLGRRWLAASDLQVEEIELDAFSPSWWLCLRRGIHRSVAP